MNISFLPQFKRLERLASSVCKKLSGEAQTTTASGDRQLEELIEGQGLPKDTLRVPPLVDSAETMSLESPKLKRPVIMVHGLAQRSDDFFNLRSFFLTNENNEWGGSYRLGEDGAFKEALKDNQDAKVFAIDLSDNLARPRAVAHELSQAISAITEVTGADKVDVVTHSMGAFVTRAAFRQGEERLGKCVFIASPNGGSIGADAVVAAQEAGVLNHFPDDKIDVMRDLGMEKNPLGRVHNEWLYETNRHWENSPDRPSTAIIVGTGVPTVAQKFPGIVSGDGTVAAYRAPLEGADFYVAIPKESEAGDENHRDFQDIMYNHLSILSHPEVLRLTAELLAGDDSSDGFKGVSKQSNTSNTENQTKALQVEFSALEMERQKASATSKKGLALTAAGGLGVLAGSLLQTQTHLGAGVALAGLGLAAVGGYMSWTGSQAQESVSKRSEEINWSLLTV